MSPVWWITSSFEGLSIRLFGHCWMLRTLQLQGARCKIVLDAKCRKTFPWSPWSCVKSKRTSILMLETKHANDVLHIFEGWNEGMYSFLLSVHNRTTTCNECDFSFQLCHLRAKVQPSTTQRMMATLRFSLHWLKSRYLGPGISAS